MDALQPSCKPDLRGDRKPQGKDLRVCSVRGSELRAVFSQPLWAGREVELGGGVSGTCRPPGHGTTSPLPALGVAGLHGPHSDPAVCISEQMPGLWELPPPPSAPAESKTSLHVGYGGWAPAHRLVQRSKQS